MSPVFVQDADGCVVPAVVDSDGTPTEAFTAAVRKHRRPRVNLPDGPDGPGVKDGKYTYHDPGTGRFAPYGFITPSKLKALLNPDARKRKEVLGELQDKLDDNDPLLAEYVRALRQGDKNRARQIAAAIRRAVIGDRPAAGDDRNAWDAGSREVAKLIPAAAKRADARGVHASNVPRNQIGMNPRVEAEAAAKERLAEMRNGGSLSVGRKVDFDEPEDAVDVNRPTAPGKVTAADVQPGDTVDGLRNVKGAHKVDTIRPDDSGAGYFIRLDGENEERFVHRDRLLTVTPGERTEPEPESVDLIDTVEEQGGFTLDPRLGELVTRGIAVAVPGESAIIKADRFREDGEAERFIGDYIRKMRDDGLGDDVMIGAWYDREHDEIVLDRVQVFPDDQREEAIQAGRDRNEQAVYDLTNSNEIPTGGSGGREDINIIGGSDGDRTSEAVEGPDGRRDRPDDVPPGFQPATPDEVRDAARLNGTVRARVGNQGRMRRFAVGDEIEARYRDDEFADVWATTPEGKRRKYRVRWDRLDAFTDTDTSGARYGTSEQVKDAAAATDGPISARIADGRLHHLGLNAGDTIQVEYLNPHHGIVHVPTRDGGVRKYKVRWDRLDAHGGTAEQATPTAPEPRTPKKKSGPASQANRDAKKARLTALAEENGYSYEEIRDAERQVGQIKEAIRAEAKAAAYDALGQLELLGGSKLKRVAPKRQVTDARTGRKVWKRDAASEWDWYDDLDAFEDRRLRSRWMVDGDDTTGGMNPDELAGWAFNAGLTPDDSIESGIGWYLEVTARIDAAESLGRGRLAPGTDRVNLNDIAPTTTGDARLDVTDLFGPQSIDDQILAVAAASRDTDANRGLDEESGYAMLGDTVHLPADEQPWTFTRDEWGAEGDRLVAAATAPDATDDDLAALKNHIPQGILDITTDDDDWGELYDWLEAAATAAGYDNVGTRGAAAPEPDAPTAPDVPEPTPADLTDGSFADALDRQRDRYAGGEWGPLSWYDTPDGRPVDREARARRLAEKLRGSYRGSVSDADVRRTHRAVAEAFPDRNLDASTLDEIDDASGGARTTGGLLVDDRYRDDVMRALYDETQRFLVDDLGLDPDGYITVVRGIAGEQGREWVEAGRPSRISAPPLTSFTTDPSQAAGYGGSRFSSASAPDASVVKVRVPVRDVVSAGGGFAGSPTEIVAMGADGGFDVVGYRSGGRGSESDEWLIPGDATPPTPEPTPDAPEVEPTLGGPVGERVGYADWQTTQPWNATLEQVEAGEIPWIVHNPGMSDWIAARWHDGRMEVPTRFFEGTDNELLVHHEVGHSVQKALFAELGDVAPLLAPFSNGTGFRSPFGGSDDPASHDNQPAEIVADAFAHLSTGTAGNFTGPGTDELFDAVATKAAEMGFDLPSRHQRQAHHDWKQLPDGRWRRTPSDGNQVQVTEDGEAFRWTSFHLAADGTEKLDSGTAGSLTDAQSAADAALAVRQSADIIEEAPDAPEPDATPVDVPETVQGLLDDLKASHPNVTVELTERGDGDEKYLTLDKIASLDRSKGEGSVVLDKILDYADRTGQPVFLTPEAGIKGGKTRLTNWYKGRGFVPNKGRRKDFRSRETMVRQPSPIEPTSTEVPDTPEAPDPPQLDPVDVVGTPEWSERRADIERSATGGLNGWDVDALNDAADFYERSASTATGSDIALHEDRAAKFRARAARIPEGGYPEPYVLDEDGDWEFSDPSFDLHTERVKAAEADVFDDEAYEAAMDQFHYRTAALRQLIAEHGDTDQLVKKFSSLENAQVTFERTHKRMKGSAAFLRDADAGRAEVLDGIDRDRPVAAVVADALGGTSGASYVNPNGFNGWNIAPLDPKLDEWEANLDAEIAKRLAKHAETEDGYTSWDAPYVFTTAGESVPATAEEIPYLTMIGGLRRGDPLHEWVMRNYTPDEVKAQLRQALADKAGANWSSPDLVPSTGAVRALAIDDWVRRMSIESGHPIDPNTPLYLNATLTPDDLVSIDDPVVPSASLSKLMGDKILRARQVLAGVPVLSLEGGRAYDTVNVDGEDVEVRSLDRNLQALALLGGTRFSGNPPDAEATLAAIDQALGETYTGIDRPNNSSSVIRDRVAEILGRPDATGLPVIPALFEHPSVQNPSPYERDLRPADDAALRRSRAAGQVIHEAIADTDNVYESWGDRTPEQVVAQAERVLRRLGDDYVPRHAAAQAEAASDLRRAVRDVMPRKREFDRRFPKDGSSDGDLARALLSWGVIGTTMSDGTTIRTFKDGDGFDAPIEGIEVEGLDGKTKRVTIPGINDIAQRHKDASGKRAFGEATITVAKRAIEHPDPEQWRSEILDDWTSTVTPEWLAGYAALDEIEWDPRTGEEDLTPFQWGDVASVEPFAYQTIGREPSPLLKVTFGDGREVYVEPGSRLRVAELRPGKDGDMRMWHVGELKLPRDAYKADSPANGYWEATRPFNQQTSDWHSVNDRQLFESGLLADVGETAANDAARRLADLDLWDRVEDPDEFLDFDDDVPDATRVVLRNVVAAMPADLLRRVGKVGVAASGTKGGRAHYNRGTKSVHLSKHSDESTAVHELFHHLEKEPELNRALWAYYTWRTGGESATLLPYSGGDHGEERSRPDSWLDPYSGKTYSNRDDHRIHRADGEAFEWWTQGAEGLFGGSPNKADPDQIAMVAGALATVFGREQVAGGVASPPAGTVAP